MPEHRIDRIDVSHYAMPLDVPYPAAWDPRPRRSSTATIVRVRAGDLEGVGSGDLMLGLAGHEDLFLGQDPRNIERHVLVLETLQFYYGRMWPLEIALWDLVGKIEDKPLWQLLGGEGPRVRVYASTGRRISNETPEIIERFKGAGFPAAKLRISPTDTERDIDIIRDARRRAGDGFEILVDANHGWRVPGDVSPSWTFEKALDVATSLRDAGVFWLEEPLHRHDYDGLAKLRQESGLRIAGGEANREFAEHREYLRRASLDVYQPDVAWSTGVLRGTQLAAEVRAAGAMYSPHTWGDGLVLLANLHVAAAASNAPFIEFPYDPPAWTVALRDFILPEPLAADGDGYVQLSDAPGLGIEIDWNAIERWRV